MKGEHVDTDNPKKDTDQKDHTKDKEWESGKHGLNNSTGVKGRCGIGDDKTKEPINEAWRQERVQKKRTKE